MKLTRWPTRSTLIALAAVAALLTSACYGTPSPPSTDFDNAEPSNPNNATAGSRPASRGEATSAIPT
jgi:hypothetical protein